MTRRPLLITRPGVQQCQAQGKVFCLLLGYIQDRTRVFWVVNILLPDHVGLPHILDLAVHLVPLQTWVGSGGIILRP